ncbi:glycosyltransferase family 4 protein [bacterium]|nr:glycosyltransferase family 4 protein [bacterium]
MKVLFLTSGRLIPSSRFRVQQYIPYLKDKKITPILKNGVPNSYYRLPIPIKGTSIIVFPFKFINRLINILFNINADIVFLQKDLIPYFPPVLEWIIFKLYKRVIYDFDDSIYLRFEKKIKFIVKNSSTVIVGNNYLRKWALQYNKNVIVIPTSVDTNRYTFHFKENIKKDPIIGWTGTSSNFKYLKILVNPLEMIKNDFKLKIISDNPKKAKLLFSKKNNVESIKWSKESEIKDLSSINIGIMPLIDNEWAKGKCGFKLIQYMALGIPCVASPVGENKNIIEDGINGFLAADNNEWVEKLQILLTNLEIYKKIAFNARRTIKKRYSIQGNIYKLTKCFQDVYEK